MKNSKAYRFLTSIRFAVILMVFLAVLCVIYTLIPQNEPLSVYNERYGTALSGILTALGLDHILTSVWMYAGALLFALNLGLCTLRRFRFALKQSGNRLRAFSSPVLHVGLCVVLAGGFISLFTGRTLYYEIPVGESVTFRGKTGDFSVRAQDFTIEYYEDGRTPKQYRTRLALEQNGSVTQDEAYVNGPVRFDGTTIIQQSFGWMIEAVISTGTAEQKIRAKDGESIPLPGGEQANYTITMHFYPDYDESTGTDAMPGPVDSNPHILWIVNRGEELVTYGILKHGMTQAISDPLLIRFDNYTRYTGLQMKYDPGITVIFAGFVLSFAGLVIRYTFGNQKKKAEVNQS